MKDSSNEFRLSKGSFQFCNTTVASNQPWKHVKKQTNKQKTPNSKNLDKQEMNCQENRTKVYKQQSWRIPTLLTWKLDDNCI